jgi:hypothetical protein
LIGCCPKVFSVSMGLCCLTPMFLLSFPCLSLSLTHRDSHPPWCR